MTNTGDELPAIRNETGSGRVSDETGLSQAEPVARLGPSGFDPSRKCECDCEGVLDPAYADWYEPDLELPYVDHAPGECRCTNELAQYETGDGQVRWLCSCCHTFGDKPFASDAQGGAA